jgi:hypothetical protein
VTGAAISYCSLSLRTGVTLSPALPAAIFTATGTLNALTTAFSSFTYTAPGAGFSSASDSIQFLLFTLSPSTAFAALNTTFVAVTLVNTAPRITLQGNTSGLLSLNQGAAVQFGSALPQWAVSDDSGGNQLWVNVSVDAGSGELWLAPAPGVTFVSAAPPAAALSFLATVSQLNAALNTLTYNSSANPRFSGSTTLTVSVFDQGFGAGAAPLSPAYLSAASATLSVAFVPLIPQWSVPPAVSGSAGTGVVQLWLAAGGGAERTVTGVQLSHAHVSDQQWLYITSAAVSCTPLPAPGSGAGGGSEVVFRAVPSNVFVTASNSPLPVNTTLSAASQPLAFYSTLNSLTALLAALTVRSGSTAETCVLALRAADAFTALAAQPTALVGWEVGLPNQPPVLWLAALRPASASASASAASAAAVLQVNTTRDSPLRVVSGSTLSAFGGALDAGSEQLNVSASDADALPASVFTFSLGAVAVAPAPASGATSDAGGAGLGAVNCTLHSSALSVVTGVSGAGSAAVSGSVAYGALAQALAALQCAPPTRFYGVIELAVSVNDNGAACSSASPALAGAQGAGPCAPRTTTARLLWAVGFAPSYGVRWAQPASASASAPQPLSVNVSVSWSSATATNSSGSAALSGAGLSSEWVDEVVSGGGLTLAYTAQCAPSAPALYAAALSLALPPLSVVSASAFHAPSIAALNTALAQSLTLQTTLLPLSPSTSSPTTASIALFDCTMNLTLSTAASAGATASTATTQLPLRLAVAISPPATSSSVALSSTAVSASSGSGSSTGVFAAASSSSAGAGFGAVSSSSGSSDALNGTSPLQPAEGSAQVSSADVLIPLCVMLLTTAGVAFVYRSFEREAAPPSLAPPLLQQSSSSAGAGAGAGAADKAQAVVEVREHSGSGNGNGNGVRYLASKFRQGRLHDLPAYVRARVGVWEWSGRGLWVHGAARRGATRRGVAWRIV